MEGNSVGAGMCIALLEGTLGVNIQIVNSIFHNNKANWGGGLCLYVLVEVVFKLDLVNKKVV